MYKALVPKVAEIIRNLPPRAIPGTDRYNPYVFASQFPSRDGSFKHYVGVYKVWNKIRLQVPGFEDVCFHLLRHNAATTGVGLNMGAKNISGFLSHKSLQSTAHYMHNNMEEMKRTAETIGRQLEEDFNADNYVPPAEKVVQMSDFK